jgi:hypothetical protein
MIRLFVDISFFISFLSALPQNMHAFSVFAACMPFQGNRFASGFLFIKNSIKPNAGKACPKNPARIPAAVFILPFPFFGDPR